MTTARLAQQVVEVVSTSTPDALLAQQVMEVVSATNAGAQVGQVTLEAILQPEQPSAQVGQVVLEVLTTSASAAFDPSTPVFLFEPDGEVTERFQWATDVQRAVSGRETRIGLREYPRQTVSFSTTATTDDDVTLLDAYIAGWQSAIYYLPTWHDRTTLGAPLASGATSMPLPFPQAGYRAGDFVAFWTSRATYELRQISSTVGGVLQWAGGLLADWPEGTTMAPVREAWLMPSADMDRFTGASASAFLTFEYRRQTEIAPLEWAEDADTEFAPPWTWAGLALFARRPNWTEAPTLTHTRRMETFGDGSTPPWRSDPSGRPWPTRTERHTATGRDQIEELIRWHGKRKGRRHAYMAIIWNSEVTVTGGTDGYGLTIRIRSRRHDVLMGYNVARTHIALRTANGWTVRKITSVTRDGADAVLSLDNPTGEAAEPADYLEAYFCEPAHLASDQMEVTWWTGDTAEITITSERLP